MDVDSYMDTPHKQQRGDDMRLRRPSDVIVDDTQAAKEIQLKPHAPGLCLNMLQLAVVCGLLILVLLLASCTTGYHSYKVSTVLHHWLPRLFKHLEYRLSLLSFICARMVHVFHLADVRLKNFH